MPEIAERVAAGAAFLDEHDPGWDQRINVAALDISSCEKCVFGQLRDNYWRGLQWLHRVDPGAEQIDLGFMFKSSDEPEDEDADIAGLTAEWKRVIGARRAATS